MLKVVEEELFQREDLTPFATNDLVMLVLAFARVQKLHPILLNCNGEKKRLQRDSCGGLLARNALSSKEQ